MSNLGERGGKVFKALAPAGSPPATTALAEEAARIADRLDELDRIIAGKGVLELMQFRLPSLDLGDGEATVEVKFDNVLAEARQQAGALRQILTTLGVKAESPAVPAAPKSAAPAKAPDSSGGGGIDDIAARRAEREARRRSETSG